MGIGLLPNMSGFTQGLTRVLPEVATPGTPVSLVWPSRRLEPARVALFRDFLATALRQTLHAADLPRL
jgi:DNA-binding transcriptional LysR family regulator